MRNLRTLQWCRSGSVRISQEPDQDPEYGETDMDLREGWIPPKQLTRMGRSETRWSNTLSMTVRKHMHVYVN